MPELPNLQAGVAGIREAAEPSLRIHDWMAGVRDVLGPGLRSVVWVQGCTLRCPGCMVPETWWGTAGRLVDPSSLAAMMLESGDVEGVTVSGGEPMQQPGPVADLLNEVRVRGKGAWVYTGYTMEELARMNHPEVDRVISLADVVVDGRYRMDQSGGHAYRGSGNQRTIAISRRGALELDGEKPPAFQVTIDQHGRMVVVGVPPHGFLTSLRQSLERRGYRLASTHNWR